MTAAAQSTPKDTTAQALPGVRVTSGASATDFVERTSDVGLGFPAELRKVPQSVHVISRRLIEEQRPVSLSEIVRNTSGVSASRNAVEVFRSFKLRGFNMLESVTDGIRNTSSLNIQTDGMANIERVEVLRGPGGAVFGLGSPGGVINIVTKKPQAKASQELQLGTGNFGYVQRQVDATGPLTPGGSLRYRLTGAYEQRNSYIDFVAPRSAQIAPTVDWQITDRLLLRYQGDWRERSQLRYVSIPFQGTIAPGAGQRLPRSLFTGEPDQGLTENRGLLQTVMLEQQRGEAGKARLYVRLNNNTFDQPSVAPRDVLADGRTQRRRFNEFLEDENERVVGAQWVGRATLGTTAHTLSTGAELSNWDYDSKFNRATIGNLDLLSPVYGSKPTGQFVLEDSRDEFLMRGAYLQDAIAVTERLTVLAGLRFDQLTNRTQSRVSNTSGESTDQQWSPRFGVSYEVGDAFIPFVSYSRNFFPNFNSGALPARDKEPLGPQRGEQWEAGIKSDIAGRAMLTLSAFRLDRDNVPIADPTDPAFQISGGLQRSRGVEAFASVNATDALSFLASYAYTDARVVRDSRLAAGTLLDNVPFNSARVWTRWSTTVDGWTARVSAGISYSGAVRTSIATATVPALVVPDFGVVDGSAGVERGRVGLDVVVQNVGDRYYFLRGAFGATGVVPGDARRVLLTVRIRH
jgi:iron complex outermembrane receptor protein